MKEQILKEIENYKVRLTELDKTRNEQSAQLQETSIAIEQTRGALSAIYQLAIQNGFVDEQGNVIKGEATEVEAEIVE